ncbi:MAG: hypothetical protein ACJ76R_05175 [Solirubrobacteraceae bacterium]
MPGASVWPLLEYLRAESAVPPEPPAVVAPVEQLVGEYRKWLVCERGLAPVTVRASERFARRFLAGRVSAGDPCGVLGITAGEVNAFLVRECARVSSGSAGCCAYRLRSLLRYLAVRGVADPGLAQAVPRVARWREATIPQFPTRPDIDRLLASCDRQDATGARDHAVLLLLARLGLRAVEVATHVVFVRCDRELRIDPAIASASRAAALTVLPALQPGTRCERGTCLLPYAGRLSRPWG